MSKHLDPAQTALLVIDVQKALFERRIPVHNADVLLANLNSLTARFLQAEALCVFVQHTNDKLLQKGTPGWCFHPDLFIDKRATVVWKTHGNAFLKTDLHELLQENGINTVVITGLVTLGCVRATCIGARELGYRVVLVSDAHSSYHKSAQARIAEWNQKFAADYGELLQTTEISLK